MFAETLLARTASLIESLSARGMKVSTAESCTGGLTAALLTEISGSSDVFERGFVTYSNSAKSELLGVRVSILRAHGAVSAEVAVAMAEGALRKAKADLAVAITGIAGPGGGSAEKPVGLVYIATASRGGEPAVSEFRFGGIGRHEVRMASVGEAIAMLENALAEP